MGEAADLLTRNGKFIIERSYKTFPFISFPGAQSDNCTLYSNVRDLNPNKCVNTCARELF